MKNQIIGLILPVLLVMGCSSDLSVLSSSSEKTVISSAKAENLGQQLPIQATVSVGEQVIELEVAQTPEQQMMGLMYRTDLAKNRGMLFPFDFPRVAPRFWMRNVKIPLDMIFLYDGEIKAILTKVPPCDKDPCPTYGPDTTIDQVVELAGGRATELGLQVGDRLSIKPVSP